MASAEQLRQYPMRVALLGSGSASTIHAVGEATLPGGPLYNKVEVAAVIANVPDDPDKEVRVEERACEMNVPYELISRPKTGNKERNDNLFRDQLDETFARHGAVLYSQNGWMARTPAGLHIPGINQHPGSTDPRHPGPPGEPSNDFGGPGMYGLRVHAAATLFSWAASHRFQSSESTIHLVTDEYDEGARISAIGVPIDNPHVGPIPPDELMDPRMNVAVLEAAHSLKERMLPKEHENVQIALLRIAQSDAYVVEHHTLYVREEIIPTLSRQHPLIHPSDRPVLLFAKEHAQRLVK